MEYIGTELEVREIPYKDFTSYDRQDIASRFRQVIETEGPVVDDFLELKVLRSYTIFQRGSLIAPFLISVLLSVEAVCTRQIDCDGQEHFVFWPEKFRGLESDIEALKCDAYTDFRPSGQKDQMPDGAFRAIADFPQIEVFNAMKAVLAEADSLKKEDLLTTTNHALGFLAKGRQIRLTLENVLKAGVANGTFVYSRRNGTVRLR